MSDVLSALGPTASTLLIPLVGRALAREHFPELGFSDPASERVLRGLNGARQEAMAALKSDRTALWGSVQRSRVFDGLAREFLARHPAATVINLGAGLCTRFERVDNGVLRWIDVDVEEVLALRKRLLPRSPRQATWASCLSVGRLPVPTREPTLVMAEGVLMFLPPRQVEALFSHFALALAPGSEIAFDYIHPCFVRHAALRPRSMKALGARYAWGVQDIAAALRPWPRLQVVSSRCFSRSLSWKAAWAAEGFRRLAGGPLFDVVRVSTSDGK